MTQPDDSLKHVSPDDALPEVVAPSASFLVPLFVVPFCIVSIIVMVWIAFNWLALRGTDAAGDIEKLGRDSNARWQAAANFADRLRNPRSSALRRDHESAQKVAAILQAELSRDLAGDADDIESHVNFRLYLSRALGEFEVVDGLPALLEAASGRGAGSSHEMENLPVRRAAIEGLSVMVSNVRKAGGGESSETFEGLLPVLVDAARRQSTDGPDQDKLASLRYTAAFALGVLGGPEALDALESMLIDANPDVRYNATCGLARHGDARAELGLIEMLDPEDDRGVNTEQAPGAQSWKRASIYQTALQATEKLLEFNQVDHFDALQAAVRRLLEEPSLNQSIRVHASDVLVRFQSRATDPVR